MKIRYKNPTEEMPFFHRVRVHTAKGWRWVCMKNACDQTVVGYFPTYERAVKAAQWTKREIEKAA